MKTILVTGGAGYVGSILVRLLLEKGFRVVVVDKLMFGCDSLKGVLNRPNFNLIKADITSSPTFREAFTDNQIDAVVHMAAIVGDPACSKDPKLAEKVNWEGSSLLLDAVKEYNIPRFIFVSTCSNYGKMNLSNGYVNESSPLAPVSLYAELKVRFEEKLLAAGTNKENFCPVILRFATAYGLSPRMRFDLTVNEFTKELALQRELEVFGEKFWRPYCHVYDLARGILFMLNADKGKVAHNVFNVGDTGENFQKKMIIDEISKVILHPKIKYVHKDEDPRDYKVSFSKIEEIGFKVTKRISDGIKEIKNSLEEKSFLNPDDKKYRNS